MLASIYSLFNPKSDALALPPRCVEESVALRRKGVFYLLIVTVIWGGTFVWMKQLLNNSEEHLTSYDEKSVVSFFVFMRFFISFVLLFILISKSRNGLTKKSSIMGGIYIGIPMFGGFLIQMIALTMISPAVSAFLTSLYVIFTALIAYVIGKQSLSLSLIFGVVMATAGAALLGLRAGDTIGDLSPSKFAWAEWLTIISAFLFAVHIIVTDKITKTNEPMGVTLSSFFTVTTLALISLLVVLPSSGLVYSELLALLLHFDILVPLLLLGILGSLVALLLLNYWQRYLSPVHAAVIYSLEPIWALTYSLFSGLEVVSIWLFFGGGLLLCGNLVVELFVRKSETHFNAAAEPSKS